MVYTKLIQVNLILTESNKSKALIVGRLSKIFLELEQKEANNANLVIPTQYIPQIIKAIIIANQ